MPTNDSAEPANDGDDGDDGVKSENAQAKEFEQLGDAPPLSLFGEFLYFLRYNKRWWLTPIILVLALLGLLAALTATGAAPFIYPF